MPRGGRFTFLQLDVPKHHLNLSSGGVQRGFTFLRVNGTEYVARSVMPWLVRTKLI